MQGERLSSTCLLFDLQTLDDGLELGQNLGRLLVVLDLRRDELGQVAQRLGGVEDLCGTKSVLLYLLSPM